MLFLVFVVFSLFAVSFFGDLTEPLSTPLASAIVNASASASAAETAADVATERVFGDGFHSFSNAFISLFALWSTDNYPRVPAPAPTRVSPGPVANAPPPNPPTPSTPPHP